MGSVQQLEDEIEARHAAAVGVVRIGTEDMTKFDLVVIPSPLAMVRVVLVGVDSIVAV